MLTDISIRIYSAITGLLRREEGQDLVEYAVLVGFIGIVAAVALALLLPAAFDDMRNTIEACVKFDKTLCKP